ncbi:AAA family ATPase [Desulfococcaceae bacterium HSG9]|nr:AAA family ATPase [Desulfococcaceae bacterium HSG9]
MSDDTFDAFVKAYNNFDYRPLEGESMQKFYVDDFTKDTTNSIVKTVKISERFKKILIIGHRGCGKSTILNKVAEDLQNEYHIVSFSVTEELNIMDVEAIDILMVIYLQLINSIKSNEIHGVKDNNDWKEQVLKPFEKLISQNLKIKEAEGAISLLKIVSFKIKVEPESRDAIRKGFKKQLQRLQQNISDACKEISKLKKKDMLVIIDDLDKLQDEEACDKIFFKETHLLSKLESKIIFTFPLFAYYSPAFRLISDQFDNKFIQLVNLYDIDENIKESSMTILKKLVLKRIDPKHVSDEAMQYLIDKSGGLLRDLILFMQNACKIVIDKEASVINDEIVQKVIHDKINEYNRIFNFPGYKDKVKQIIQDKNKEGTKNDDVIYLLRYLFVMEYGSAGEKSWYDAHPCLKACLEG